VLKPCEKRSYNGNESNPCGSNDCFLNFETNECVSFCPSNSISNEFYVCINIPPSPKSKQQKSSSFPWWIILIIILTLLIIIIIIFILIKKKRRNKNENTELSEYTKTMESLETNKSLSSIPPFPLIKSENEYYKLIEENLSNISDSNEKDDDEDLHLNSLIHTPITYNKLSDEFIVNKDVPKTRLVRIRKCDSPHNIVYGDKKRTLFAILNEIQVLFY
jgi:hypothetical protein